MLPKANGQPIMSLLSFAVDHFGQNIVGVNKSAIPTYFNTTGVVGMYDQAVLNLGIGENTAASRDDIDDNKINLRFKAIVNDYSNITNDSTYWVGAGVIGKPKMVWVGQIKVKTYVANDAKPTLKIDVEIKGDG